MGTRRPDLLPVDDPLVALAHGARPQAGQIRAGGRLREELAPDLLTGERARRIAPLVLFARVGEEGGHAHAQPDFEVAAGDEEVRFLLAPDHLLDGAPAPASVLAWPRDAGEPGVRLAALEVLGPGQAFGLLVARLPRLEGAALGIGILLEPAPGLGAKGRFGRRVAEVHGSS